MEAFLQHCLIVQPLISFAGEKGPNTGWKFEKLWKWQWGSSAKKSHSSEEKQHILVSLEFHGQGTEESFILAEKAVLTADLNFSLNPWYDASHFSNNTNNWIMLLNIYWAF